MYAYASAYKKHVCHLHVCMNVLVGHLLTCFVFGVPLLSTRGAPALILLGACADCPAAQIHMENKKWKDAIPLLEDAYEDLKDSFLEIHMRCALCIPFVVEFWCLCRPLPPCTCTFLL